MSTKKQETEAVQEIPKQQFVSIYDQFHVSRRLTLPIFSMSKRSRLACGVTGEITTIKLASVGRNGDSHDVPVIPVFDLESGEEGLLILHTLIHSALSRDAKPLTGRFFAIAATGIVAGKRYRDIQVVELTRNDAPEANA